MTKLKLALLAVLPIAGGGMLWAGSSTRSAAAEPATKPATIVHSTTSIIAPAHVEPERDPVSLAFETAGRVASIAVDEGTAVKAGDPIAKLDDRMALARVAAAQAAVDAAKARLALAKRGARAEDLAAARAEALAAQELANHRGAERDRSDRLRETGALASSVVEADDAAARVATAQASAAQARYAALAHGTRIEQIDEAAAQLAAAQADLDAARVALDQMTLRAPTDGVIVRRTAEVGQLVTLMAPVSIVTLADLRRLEVRAELDEADIATIATGQIAYATADAFGDRRFPVRIARITNELGRRTVRDDDPRARVDARVLEVIASFDQLPDVKLPLGLRMSVHFDR